MVFDATIRPSGQGGAGAWSRHETFHGMQPTRDDYKKIAHAARAVERVARRGGGGWASRIGGQASTVACGTGAMLALAVDRRVVPERGRRLLPWRVAIRGRSITDDANAHGLHGCRWIASVWLHVYRLLAGRAVAMVAHGSPTPEYYRGRWISSQVTI